MVRNWSGVSWPFGREPSTTQLDCPSPEHATTENPPENAPEVVAYNAPEVVAYDAPELKRSEEAPLDRTQPQERKILGIPRTRFFIILAATILVVIVAIIGGVVGGVLASNDPSDSDSSESASNTTTNTPTPSQSPGSPLYDISSTSNLATVNWTTGGVDYIRVYYQHTSGDIIQAGWDSETLEWAAGVITDRSNLKNADGSEIDPSAPIDVKQGTPLATMNFNDPSDVRAFEINLFYVDSFNALRQIWTQTAHGPWYTEGNDLVNIAEGSQLAAVRITDCDCDHPSLVVYQSDNGYLNTLDQNDWPTPFLIPDLDSLALGATFAMAPFKDRTGSRLFMNLKGHLGQMVYDHGVEDPGWFSTSEPPLDLAPASQIAAYAVGDLDTYYEFFVVYYTQPQGGVGSLKGKNDGGTLIWTDEEEKLSEMDDVAPNAVIVVNELGMIFALTTIATGQGANATALIQWRLDADGMPTRVGEVPTRAGS